MQDTDRDQNEPATPKVNAMNLFSLQEVEQHAGH